MCYPERMKRKALLINPWIHDFAAYDLWNKPIGLLYLASLLRANDVEVFFLDALDPFHPALSGRGSMLRRPKRNDSGHGSYAKAPISKPPPLKTIPRNYSRYGIPPEVFRNSLTSIPLPDLILVTSMMTYWYPGVFDAIRIVREIFPPVPIVLGGNYVTLCPQHASFSGADYCLPGRAEATIPSLWRELFHEELPFVPDDRDLDSHPFPSFDLIRHPQQVPILTSRGCPYRCSYCASPLLHPRFERRDPIRVAEEIEYWHGRLGIRHFSFYDDALLFNPPEMANPLLREILGRQRPIQFHCPNGLHLRHLSPELALLLFQANFKTLRFGLETANASRQTSSGGKVTNKEFAEAMGWLKRAGYGDREIGIYLLCGLPEQTADEVRESIRFVRSCGATPILAEYSPIPGTPLWDDAVSSSSYPIADEPLFHNNTLLPCRSASLTWEIHESLKRMARDPECGADLSSSANLLASVKRSG